MSVIVMPPVEIAVINVRKPVVVQPVVALPPVILNATIGHAGLWTGEGPPPPDGIAGAQPGDEYLDTVTGDVYVLDVSGAP